MQVRSSCPAPAGGISIQLAADPSNRLAIPASAVIPAGQDSVTFDIEALGSQCADVIVTAQAAGHLDATHLLTVYDRPQLFSLSPDVIDACRPFELTIEGTCFKEGRDNGTRQQAG